MLVYYDKLMISPRVELQFKHGNMVYTVHKFATSSVIKTIGTGI